MRGSKQPRRAESQISLMEAAEAQSIQELVAALPLQEVVIAKRKLLIQPKPDGEIIFSDLLMEADAERFSEANLDAAWESS